MHIYSDISIDTVYQQKFYSNQKKCQKYFLIGFLISEEIFEINCVSTEYMVELVQQCAILILFMIVTYENIREHTG